MSYSPTLKTVMIVLGFLATAWLSHAAIVQDLNALKAGVVKITTKTGQVGTGFIVRLESEGVYIVTAAHVIAGDNQPEVEFFTQRQNPLQGTVLPGAQINDDIRGLALILVRGDDDLPAGIEALPFSTMAKIASVGKEVDLIGHPGGFAGDWALVKRDISNRVVHDITMDGSVASKFSGGPIVVEDTVVGMVTSTGETFSLGITHTRLLNYLDGSDIQPGMLRPTSSANKKVANGSPAQEPKTLSQTKTGKDGGAMVLVPAGAFTMGSPDGEGDSDEHRQHTVDLDGFYIDQYEVTVERYQRFKTQTNRAKPEYWDQVDLRRDGKKPVVGINWNDAKAYCKWAEKRLPTEAEWEKAARGTDKRTYPWGESSPNSSTANFDKDWNSDVVYAEKLKAVGSYERGKSPYGVYDMAGNVWEWVADWYDADYYQASPRKNPTGPSSGEQRVLRGGSWNNNPTNLRSAYRYWLHPAYRYAYFGVRCAHDAP